jgi:hypothetical protein
MQSFLNYIACDFIGGSICGLLVTPVVSYAPRPMLNVGLGQSDNNFYALYNRLENAGRNGKWDIGLKYRSQNA